MSTNVDYVTRCKRDSVSYLMFNSYSNKKAVCLMAQLYCLQCHSQCCVCNFVKHLNILLKFRLKGFLHDKNTAVRNEAANAMATGQILYSS